MISHSPLVEVDFIPDPPGIEKFDHAKWMQILCKFHSSSSLDVYRLVPIP